MGHRYIGTTVKKSKKILLLIFILSLFCMPRTYGQQTDITGVITSGPTISLISIAVDDFKIEDNIISSGDSVFCQGLQGVLTNDLQFSLYFNVVKPDSAFLADFAKGEMKLDDWIYLGAQMLVKSRVKKQEDLYTISIQVIDVFRDKMVYNNEFLGSAQNYRSLAHRIAADLLFNLTGEKGVFDSKIAYSSEVNGNRDIWICDFDGHNPMRITNDKAIDQMPAWSDTGDRIYFTTDRKGNHDLYGYMLEKDEFYIVSNREGLNFAAAPSPDGKLIALTLSIAGNSEIYLLDIAGRIMRRLTYSWAIDTSPTWSPNSREIAFISDRAGNPQLYVTDVDGINTRRLTYYGDYISDPAWSPRSDYIAYCSREAGLFQIYIVDITGQKAYKLTEIGSNEAPVWSSDGLHLVYASNVDGSYGLWVMNFDGSGKHKLNLSGNCKSPSWSANLK